MVSVQLWANTQCTAPPIHTATDLLCMHQLYPAPCPPLDASAAHAAAHASTSSTPPRSHSTGPASCTFNAGKSQLLVARHSKASLRARHSVVEATQGSRQGWVRFSSGQSAATGIRQQLPPYQAGNLRVWLNCANREREQRLGERSRYKGRGGIHSMSRAVETWHPLLLALGAGPSQQASPTSCGQCCCCRARCRRARCRRHRVACHLAWESAGRAQRAQGVSCRR